MLTQNVTLLFSDAAHLTSSISHYLPNSSKIQIVSILEDTKLRGDKTNNANNPRHLAAKPDRMPCVSLGTQFLTQDPHAADSRPQQRCAVSSKNITSSPKFTEIKTY